MNPSFESIRIAIESRLASWDGVPVLYDGSRSPNTQDARDTRDVTNAIRNSTAWVRCTIQHGSSFTAGVGSAPCVRRTGLISFQIFTPEHQGSHPAALLADSLAQHFEYHQDGNFETLAASAQRVGPTDGWYQYNVTCPFRAG
ncbi:phage tail terminator-like protein [Halomonas sp. S3-1-1]|uniref:phage tail terminator-like protein n=1 Tax=unclassified Halomonas TaxID=2609666 RepID=UPI0020768842|nr:phage tail terminator-like protein [Halomonas sp. S3-1-1]